MIALVTIGQSPREDIVASMFPPSAIPPILQAGALDELQRSEIDALRPGAGDHLLVTRLADGSEVAVAKEGIMQLMQDAIDRVEEHGATVVCVLCTGSFDGLTANVRVVYPDRIVRAVIDGIAPDGTLGVLMPHPAQHEVMLDKWARPGRSVVTAATSPYAERADLRSAVASLVSRGAEMIVMDCMGFDRSMQAIVRGETDVPVVLSNALLGSVLLEMFGRGLD